MNVAIAHNEQRATAKPEGSSLSPFDPEPMLETARLLETADALRDFLQQVEDASVVAIDTESANFYRYHARLNLLQMATPLGAALIDPQAITDFSALREFAANRDREWVFHGGDYDGALLQTELGVIVPRVFDTLLAANFLGLPELGLSALSEKYLGFPLDKKYQRCDWSRRPLTTAMKRYALLDAVCLLPLRESMTADLERRGRLAWLQEECVELVTTCRTAQKPAPNPHAFLVKGAVTLSARGRAVLKELWLLREDIAAGINRAPFMVVGNQGLLEMACSMPQTRAGLSVLKNVHRDFLQRYGERVVTAIKTGLQAPPIDMPRPPRPPSGKGLTAWEADLLRLIRERRNLEAEHLGIPASMLACPQQLLELAKLRPADKQQWQTMAGLKQWQTEVLFPVVIDLLTHEPTATKPKKSPRRSRRHSRRSTANS